MSQTLELLRTEARARRFFAAYAQSSLGNGAGYVALVVLAYSRWHSPWAITLVLIADFVPSMLLGPLFGALADRWSRRGIAILSDLMRAAAFVGLGLVGGIWATIGLALLAGAGAGMFTPAVLAALPSIVETRRAPAAVSLYGAITDGGRFVGPGLAAVGLTLAGPTAVVVGNGATFLLSALIVASLRFGAAPRRVAGERQSVLRQAREGVVDIMRTPGVRTLVLASSGVILFGAMVNVAELLLARSLGVGAVGYSILVAIFCGGTVVGSLTGAAGRHVLPLLKRRYLLGLVLIGAGLLAAAVPSYPVAAMGLALAGLGSGVALVNERLICQRAIPDQVLARAYAAFDTAGSWAFAIAFVGAGALLSLTGPRPLLLVAGLGTVAIWMVARLALAGTWEERAAPSAPRVGAPTRTARRDRAATTPVPATAAARARVESAVLD